MVSSVFDTDIGVVAPFQDNRQVVQDSSNLIAEQQDIRVASMDAQTKINNISALTSIGESLLKIGYNMAEDKAVQGVLGDAENQQEAIASTQRQGQAVVDMTNTLSNIAQARASGSMSPAEGTRRANVLIKEAKNASPMFAKAIQKAAERFVTGGVATLGQATITTLSSAERAEQAYIQQVQLRASQNGVSFENAARSIQMENLARNDLLMMQVNSSRVGANTRQFVTQQNAINRVAQMEWANDIQSAIEDTPGGLTKDTVGGFTQIVNQWERKALADLAVGATSVRDIKGNPVEIAGGELAVAEQSIKDTAAGMRVVLADNKRMDFVKEHIETLQAEDTIYLLTEQRDLLLLGQLMGQEWVGLRWDQLQGSQDEIDALMKNHPRWNDIINAKRNTGTLEFWTDTSARIVDGDTTLTKEEIEVYDEISEESGMDFPDLLPQFIRDEAAYNYGTLNPNASDKILTRESGALARKDKTYLEGFVDPYIAGNVISAQDTLNALNGGKVFRNISYSIRTQDFTTPMSSLDFELKDERRVTKESKSLRDALNPQITFTAHSGIRVNAPTKRAMENVFSGLVNHAEALWPTAVGDTERLLRLVEDEMVSRFPNSLRGKVK